MSSENDRNDLPEQVPWTVVIAGVGLIGGSIGMRLKRERRPIRVVGMGRNEDRLKIALELGAIDSYTTQWPAAMAEADAVILCGPVSSIVPGAKAAWRVRKSDKVWLSDAGSTKGRIMAGIAAEPGLASAFIGAHPIAGSERSGVEASRADLFEGRVCVLTPGERSAADAVQSARSFWESLGSRVVCMAPETHDAVLARTSHLPHVLSSILARSVRVEDLDMAAGAFRDMTRVAGADAGLWADIFLGNREFLDESLDRHMAEVLHFKDVLSSGSPEELIRWWNVGRETRAAFEQREAGLGAKFRIGNPGESTGSRVDESQRNKSVTTQRNDETTDLKN